jgi:hypothetical protein
VLSGIEGMKLKAGQAHEDEAFKKLTSINETIHKVKVLTPYSFTIGDTRKYEPYVGKGIVKQLKTKVELKAISYAETLKKKTSELPLDMNMMIADFEKMHQPVITHLCFLALDEFKKQSKGEMPRPWNLEDAQKFVGFAKKLAADLGVEADDLKEDGEMLKWFYIFPMQAQGVLNPMCAFLGGYVSQEAIKAITQKFMPTHQLFYYDAVEVVPTFNVKDTLLPLLEKNKEQPVDKVEKAFQEEIVAKEIHTLPL